MKTEPLGCRRRKLVELCVVWTLSLILFVIKHFIIHFPVHIQELNSSTSRLGFKTTPTETKNNESRNFSRAKTCDKLVCKHQWSRFFSRFSLCCATDEIMAEKTETKSWESIKRLIIYVSKSLSGRSVRSAISALSPWVHASRCQRTIFSHFCLLWRRLED